MEKYCVKCGTKLEENVNFCPNCGHKVGQTIDVNTNDNQFVNNNVNTNSKYKLAAGILGILVGTVGVHNFYLGYTSKAIAQLLLGTIGVLLFGLGPIISGIWGFVEGILILTDSINKDAKGNPYYIYLYI